jgi:putative transcriptional regulator
MKDAAFQKIMRGAVEGVEIARGKRKPARVTVCFGPAEIKRIRTRLGLSQREFADRFGIPIDTIQHWEQGRREPDRAAMAFYQVLSKQPEAALAAFA